MNLVDTSSFKEIIQVADGNNDLEYLYTYQNENVSDVIAYDKTDSSYILIEEDKVNNTSTITVNDETYLLNKKNRDLSLINKGGNELVFYEEFIDETYPTPLMPAEGEEIRSIDGENPSTYTTWKMIGGPFHKTSKMSFKVLEIIGTVGSALSLLVGGSVLGTVVFLYTTAVSVGSTLNPTIHIKYYQYGAADCMTYIREMNYYYGAYSEISKKWFEQINLPSGASKVTFNYFHSQRPDYTGNPACMSY